jgi:molybdate transport system substrate-binding protein
MAEVIGPLIGLKKITRSLVFFYVCLLTCLLAPSMVLADTLNVAVAANFKASLKVLKPAFETKTGHRLNIISSGTGHLSNQILNGAPFDIFLAANEKHPKHVFSQIKETRKLSSHALSIYAHGRLVLLGVKPLPKKSLFKLLQGSDFSKIAIANSKLAPYGLAAQQTLQHLKLNNRWQGNIVRGQNVAQVYQFIHTGNVAAGFVAYSLVQHLPSNRFIEVPTPYYQPIKQMALRLNNKKISIEFMTFLTEPLAHDIIYKAGYTLPTKDNP